MIFSNFRNLIETEERDFATIDVTTGFWLWKKKESETIFKTKDTIYWRYLETGEFTYGNIVETLVDAYKAKKDLEDHDRR